MLLLRNYVIAMIALFIVLALIGGINNYSPIPFWDMWDGYLDPYINFIQGDYLTLFAQHNEHRIVVSKLLFFIDLHYFNGASLFLTIVNYLLLALFALLMLAYTRKLSLEKSYGDHGRVIIAGVILLFAVSWVQKENLTWAFQSQFFLAYLLPLFSFYALYRATETKPTLWFLLALIAGFLSAGTMANGILALPILFILALVLRQSYPKLVLIAVLTLITIVLYFHQFHSNPAHGSITQTLLHTPTAFFAYILTYIGNPFYALFFKQLLIAQLFGLLYIASAAYLLFKTLFQTPNDPKKALILSLFAFIIFIGATAFGTAGGRAIFGVEQALSSRYATPVIFAWIALYLIALHLFCHKLTNAKGLYSALFIFSIALLIVQVEAFGKETRTHFERNVAAMALQLNAKDTDYLSKLFPSDEHLLHIAARAKQHNLSIFNAQRSAWQHHLGDEYCPTPKPGLTAHLDRTISLPDGAYKRLEGWVVDTEQQTPPTKLLILEHNTQQIVGYALVGAKREDVAEHLANRAFRYAGFVGYIRADASAQLQLVEPDTRRAVELRLAPNQ